MGNQPNNTANGGEPEVWDEAQLEEALQRLDQLHSRVCLLPSVIASILADRAHFSVEGYARNHPRDARDPHLQTQLTYVPQPAICHKLTVYSRGVV